jgi:alkylhydroperoxidase family enzyme
MAHIRQVDPESSAAAADPVLDQIYREAVRRAGKVWNIVKLTSLAPRTTRASLALYQEVMHGPSPLTRRMREALAVVVSRANDCHY